MIELPQSFIVKPFPATIESSLKLATAAMAFILITFLLAGSTDEIQTAVPDPEDDIPVYSQSPEEEIDYEELLNRIPLRNPAPKPAWMDWTSEKKPPQAFG